MFEVRLGKSDKWNRRRNEKRRRGQRKIKARWDKAVMMIAKACSDAVFRPNPLLEYLKRKSRYPT